MQYTIDKEDFTITLDGNPFTAIVKYYTEKPEPSVGYDGDFSIEEVQIEVGDNIWADVRPEHHHLVRSQVIEYLEVNHERD